VFPKSKVISRIHHMLIFPICFRSVIAILALLFVECPRLCMASTPSVETTVGELPRIKDPKLLQGEHVRSLRVFRPKEVRSIHPPDDFFKLVFDGMEELPLQLEASTRLSEIIPGTPRANAVEIYRRVDRYIELARQLFGDIPFSTQKDYQDLSLVLSDAVYGSSSNRFVFPEGKSIPATLIYHEVGHRLFWLLQERTRLGGPNDILHVGLLEYFTASFANDPIVQIDARGRLQRDVSASVRFPDGLVTLSDTIRRFEAAYKDEYEIKPYHRDLVKAIQAVPNFEQITDGHQCGLVITKPLWDLRLQFGAESIDHLVADAILALPKAIDENRPRLPDSLRKGAPSQAQWFDFLAALLDVNETRRIGTMEQIVDPFRKAGFDVSWVSPLRNP
jgi:hypothetical protein